LPMMTSSTTSGWMPARSIAALMTVAPSSCAARLERLPIMLPMGVRAMDTRTIGSDMCCSCMNLYRRRDGSTGGISPGQAARGSIRKDVLDAALRHTGLARLPPLRLQKVGVMFQEGGADTWIAQQEILELFRKDIVRFH